MDLRLEALNVCKHINIRIPFPLLMRIMAAFEREYLGEGGCWREEREGEKWFNCLKVIFKS